MVGVRWIFKIFK